MSNIHSTMITNDLKRITCFLLVLFPLLVKAQSVVISEASDANPAPSAILDVQSTDQGVLVPRMNMAQRNSIANPANGLLIYQTDNTPGFYFRNGAVWEALRSSGGITAEEDPQVGEITTNFIPRWNGTALVSSSLQENTTSGQQRISFFNSAQINPNGSGWFINSMRVFQNTSDFLSNDQNYKGYMGTSDNGYGLIFLKNIDSRVTVRIGATFDTWPNTIGERRGGVYVYNGELEGGAPPAGIEVNATGEGRIFGNVLEISGAKSFVESHPLDPSKEIVYACVEGPETAMYMRGTAQLINGRAVISLPEHYTVLAVESSMTVLVTPLSAQSTGLAVTAKSLEGVIVEELMGGTGSYAFDWEVKCVRKGFENFQVVREKNSASDPNR